MTMIRLFFLLKRCIVNAQSRNFDKSFHLTFKVYIARLSVPRHEISLRNLKRNYHIFFSPGGERVKTRERKKKRKTN